MALVGGSTVARLAALGPPPAEGADSRAQLGSAPAAVTQFKTVTIGKTLIENRRILSADFRSRNSVGIYGGDFMRELDAVITYREMRLFLRQK